MEYSFAVRYVGPILNLTKYIFVVRGLALYVIKKKKKKKKEKVKQIQLGLQRKKIIVAN